MAPGPLLLLEAGGASLWSLLWESGHLLEVNLTVLWGTLEFLTALSSWDLAVNPQFCAFCLALVPVAVSAGESLAEL